MTRSTHKKTEEFSFYASYIIEFSKCNADLAILTILLIYSRSQGSLLNGFKKFVDPACSTAAISGIVIVDKNKAESKKTLKNN